MGRNHIWPKNILDIAQNCSIEFIDDIIPVQYPSAVRSVNANENDSNIIEAEIKNLLDKKVIQEVTFVEGQLLGQKRMENIIWF